MKQTSINRLQYAFAAYLRIIEPKGTENRNLVPKQLGISASAYSKIRNGILPANPALAQKFCKTFRIHRLDYPSLVELLNVIWTLNKTTSNKSFDETLKAHKAMSIPIARLLERLESIELNPNDSPAEQIVIINYHSATEWIELYLQTPYIKSSDETASSPDSIYSLFKEAPSVYLENIFDLLNRSTTYPSIYLIEDSRKWELTNNHKFTAFFGVFNSDQFKNVILLENVKLFNNYSFVLSDSYSHSMYFISSDATRRTLDQYKSTLIDSILVANGIEENKKKREELQFKIRIESYKSLGLTPLNKFSQLMERKSASIIWAYKTNSTPYSFVGFKRIKDQEYLNGESLSYHDTNRFINLFVTSYFNDEE